MPKKVKTSISQEIYDVLINDRDYFEIEIGSIGNRLIKYYRSKKLDIDNNSVDKKSKMIQFNLNNENDKMFFDILNDMKIDLESEFLRRIFYAYSKNPCYERERILFSNELNEINKAIINKKKLNIKYNRTVRKINPYFIKLSDYGNRTYIFCYCEKNKKHIVYKLSLIQLAWLSNEDIEIYDNEYIEKINDNFDPFLSYGNELKVKLTKSGINKLSKIVLNRPKILKIENDIYTFMCNDIHARIYFAQFYNDAIIIEPTYIAKEIKKELLQMIEQYNMLEIDES